MKYKPYPRYKKSGVEWLGQIPEQWTVSANVGLFEERIEKEGGNREEILAVSIEHGIMPQSEYMGLVERKVSSSDDLSNYKRVIVNDMVYNKMRMWQGAVGDSKYDGMVSPAYVVLKPKNDVNSRYFRYLFRTDGFITEAGKLSYGLCDDMNSLRFADFKTIMSIKPPKEEQASIATFLDRETARIEALIDKKQAQIRLLQEKRQALISHVVTKGLDPNVPMKESGIEWLGQVPEHWGVTRIKFIADKIVDCPHETPNYSSDGEYIVLRTADIGRGVVDVLKARRLDRGEYERRIRRCCLNAGDIVYGREGERWGLAALVPDGVAACLGQRMMQFRCGRDMVPGYLMWHLNTDAVYSQGEVDTVGATSPHVNVETIRNYFLCLPPHAEQESIIRYIDSKVETIDSIVNKIQSSIDFLREHRSALITAAVTGQIDVREMA